MQFSRQRHRPNDDERILPLTNIVFLLLIFFMLAGQLSNPNMLGIQPPNSISDAAAGHSGLMVQVNMEGAIALDGAAIATAELEPTVRNYLAEHPQGLVQLKADGLTEASRVVAIMSVLRDAGVERLHLLTTKVER